MRLIDADELMGKAYWHGEHPNVDNLFAEGVDAVDVSDIEEAPTIEAELVRHGYWETVVEVMDNTVCGNGVKIEYKRCSCCKNPSKNFEDVFCGNCGAKLDLQEPPKGGSV